MSDIDWASGLMMKVAAFARGGDTVARFRCIEEARQQVNGSELRLGILIALEVYMPELDGEIGARRAAEALAEKLSAGRTVFNGPVHQAPGSTIGQDNSEGKTASETKNGRNGR